ncbi:MAG: hypothetical protein IPH49_13765 [Ignavibacteria bacterium]|nr:hypothetical protein [Ignavibacteria bacterium]
MVSAVGSTSRETEIVVDLPKLRLDNVTQIINLAGLESALTEQKFAKALAVTDTGTRTTHLVTPSEDGWYRVQERVLDSEGNTSPLSDSLWIYTGSLQSDAQNFTTEPRYHKILGNWGNATNFYRSAPASYAHSPSGAYLPNRRDTVQIFPFAVSSAVIPEYPTPALTVSVAAFLIQATRCP